MHWKHCYLIFIYEIWFWLTIFVCFCSDFSSNQEKCFAKYAQKQLPEVFYEKRCSKNFAKFTGKYLWQSLFFNKVAGAACNFIKKETVAQVFFWEFCATFKNTFFTKHLRTTASICALLKFSKIVKDK